MRDTQLDGLRGLAAIGIVIFHAHYAEWLDWMWRFVDLFFVLSGFLITRIIIDGLTDNSFSLRNFMIRRALRIWPIYYLTLAFCIFAILANYLIRGSWENISGLITAPFFLQYTHHYLAPEFNAGKEDFILWFHHSWSIAVEEQFYLLMPLMLIALRRNLSIALGVVLVLIPIAVAVRLEGAFQLLLIYRMDALCVGVLLAFYWAKRTPIDSSNELIRKFTFSLFTIIGLFLVFIHFLPIYVPFDYYWAFSLLGYNLTFGMLVLVLMERWLPSLNYMMSTRAMVFLGSISYALYLFHVPIRGVLLYIFDEKEIGSSPIYVQIAYFSISVLTAYLSKILIENRVNRLKYRFPVRVISRNNNARQITAAEN